MRRQARLYPALSILPPLTAALLAFSSYAHATKLDLSSEVEFKGANYGHLIYGAQRNSQALYTESAALGFVIKDIRLEQAPQSTMEVGIVLQSVGAGASSGTVVASPQFSDAANRLPQSNGTPFVREAYVRILDFVKPDVTATFGRQSFTLGQGISLASDDLGLPGGRLEIKNIYHGIKTDLFFFRPFNSVGFTQLYGGSAYYPGSEGVWQLYHFWQQDTAAPGDIVFDTAAKTKKFTGLRYVLTQKQLSFDGEAVIQRGTSKKRTGGTAAYEAHAFMMTGSWKQDLAFFGKSRIRLGYGRSSGNPGANADTDKAFFPAFGKKYKGLERSGYGEIAGASLYDIVKTSPTANGLPDGVSGLNIIVIGADLTYRKLLLSADLYKFRSTNNASGGSLQIASEWDLKVTYPLSDRMRLTAVYATFTPLGLYLDKTQSKLVYGAVSAKF